MSCFIPRGDRWGPLTSKLGKDSHSDMFLCLTHRACANATTYLDRGLVYTEVPPRLVHLSVSVSKDGVGDCC